MNNEYRNALSHIRLIALALSLAALTGCDTTTDVGNEDTQELPPLEGCDGDLATLCDLRFEVSTSGLDGGTATIDADKTVDLGPYLQDVEMGGGFSRSDVVNAEVMSVELESSNLGALESATLRFQANGVEPQVVAERSFSSGFDDIVATLSPSSDDVSRFVRKEEGFEVALTVDVRNPQPNATYSFLADLEMQLEVQGS